MRAGHPRFYGRYWFRLFGNGLAVEISQDGTEETVFLQGAEAAELIDQIDQTPELHIGERILAAYF